MSESLFHFSTDHDCSPVSFEALELFRQWRGEGHLGFLDLPLNSSLHDEASQLAAKYTACFDTLFVAGIGGSSLGLRAILSALGTDLPGKVVVVDSPDSLVIRRAVSGADPGRSAVAVVTKSGGTAETMSIFMELRRLLGSSIRVIAITDPVRGELRKLCVEKQWDSLPVPPNVGGRFSVLSPVGLFPAGFAGVDTQGLLNGARNVLNDFDTMGERSLAGRMTGAFLASFKSHPIHVFMPYSNLLYDMALWFAQLWGESLGKAKSLSGAPVNTGQTPLACRGPADQHSLVQLFMEGPADKTATIVTEGFAQVTEPVPGEFSHIPTMGYLEGRSPDELRTAEAEATAAALAERGLPVSRIHIPEISAEYTGQLFMSLEIATVLCGLALGINPLDQPGVERGKILTYRAMKREGY